MVVRGHRCGVQIFTKPADAVKPPPEVMEERQRWFYRRLLVFSWCVLCGVCVGACIAILAFKSDLWTVAAMGMTALCVGTVTVWLYMAHVASASGLANVFKGAAQGIAAASQAQGPNYGLE